MSSLLLTLFGSIREGATRDEALGKRADGSLAILCIMILARAGDRFGLTNIGEAGIVLTCCIMIAAGLLPRKGSVPVQIS